MKTVLLFCILAAVCGAPAKGDECRKVMPSETSVVTDKEALRKMPRLGMTLGQLDSLWGNWASGGSRSTDIYGGKGGFYGFSFLNVGKLSIDAIFHAEFDDVGNVIAPKKNPCESIILSYVNKKIPLTFGTVVDIAEVLLPGYSFDRPQGNEEEWKQKQPLVSRDPQHKYSLKMEFPGQYAVYFTTPLAIEEPERKTAVELDKL